jgi:hypothetical protein
MNNLQKESATSLLRIKPTLSTPLVAPIADIEEILESWRNFNQLKMKLLDDSDFVTLMGEKYARKSTFRKLALVFGISTEIKREERVEIKDGYAYEITMRASSPSGRFMTAVASCHSNERHFSKDSDVRAIAQTRATNRAIADLIGWSAPSAEEMMSEMPTDNPSSNQAPTHTDFFDKVVCSPVNRPVRKQERIDTTQITDKQKSLLRTLISDRVHNEEAKQEQIGMLDNLTKSEAHTMISGLLSIR